MRPDPSRVASVWLSKSAGTYEEYVARKKRVHEEPLSKEEWEAKVNGKGDGGGKKKPPADPAEAKSEVHDLIKNAPRKPKSLKPLFDAIKKNEPLTADHIEQAARTAERLIDEAQHEMDYGVRDLRSQAREDRDHAKKLLKAIQKLNPAS